MSDHYTVDPDTPDPAVLAEAGRRLRSGGVIAHPSDTVFGLAAAARHPEAVHKLRTLKGAIEDRPFIVLIDEPVRIDNLTHSIHRYVVDLLAAYWPGPLTLIFHARPGAPGASADGSIALRCPAQALTRGLIRECAGLMASTSANKTGQPTVKAGREALDLFGSGPNGLAMAIDAIPAVDGAGGSRASTIVDCRGDRPRLVRQGIVHIAGLEEAAGPGS